MSDKKTLLKIWMMEGSWDVEVPKNVWKEVSEWCENKGYSRNIKYPNKHRIFATTLDLLMDLIKKTSEVTWERD